MILLDWTRMGRSYCLAGVVMEKGVPRVVRPLLARYKDLAVRNVGWSPFLLDGHSRWDVFELVGATPAAPEPPHLEDTWVRGLKTLGRQVSQDQRRAILHALAAPSADEMFGAPLLTTRSAAYLNSGQGQASLGTLVIASSEIRFSVLRRAGAAGADVRVDLGSSGLSGHWLAVKDHLLLLQAEQATTTPAGLQGSLSRAVTRMGPRLAVRLGLSRAFLGKSGEGAAMCWLMADGFFSFADPQG
jgi:hypothetical protein